MLLIAEEPPEMASSKKREYREMYANVKKIFSVVLDMIICGRLVCLAMHLLLEMSHNVGPSFAPLEPLPQKQPPVEKKKM